MTAWGMPQENAVAGEPAAVGRCGERWVLGMMVAVGCRIALNREYLVHNLAIFTHHAKVGAVEEDLQ